MKNLFLLIIIITFCVGSVSGDAGKQEEIDFLLFLPNSSNRFADNAQAVIHLDKVANYLKGRDILPGQIIVYGYAANVVNNIDSTNLSMKRALFVIQELQKRGIAGELFADPVGYGSVDLWGSNTNEANRSLNRRVRILVKDIVLTPAIVAAEPVVVIPLEEPIKETIRHEYAAKESRSAFPWWLLLLLLLLLLIALAAIVFFTSKRKKNVYDKPVPPTIPVQPEKKIKILEEEEIRQYAYGLYERRNGRNGDVIIDWYQSIYELTAYYESYGYRVILYWEQWA